MDKSNRAARQWEKARIPYGYYQDYLTRKNDRYLLSVIDLLFISNFKGGSAVIGEKKESLEKKLSNYCDNLRKIADKYGQRTLRDFTEPELSILISDGEGFLRLSRDSDSRIDGFGPSYASALLNAHFPNLFPIIDRRTLSGAGIGGVKTDTLGQVKEIEQHYDRLMRFFHQKLKGDNSASIEMIDRELFSKELREEFKQKKKRSSNSSGWLTATADLDR